MKIEIQASNDDSFSLVNSNENVESSEIETKIEIQTNSDVSENQENAPGAAVKAPRPAPIENNSGTGWFAGTSWG